MSKPVISEQQLRELRRKTLTIIGLPLAAAAVVALFFYLLYAMLSTHELNELTTVLTARTIGQANEFNTFCVRATAELDAAATFTAVTDTRDLELYRKLAAQNLANLPLFSALLIGFAEDEKMTDNSPAPLICAVRTGTKNDAEITLRDLDEQHRFFEDWFLLPRLLGKTAWTDPHQCELTEGLHVAGSVPLFANGKFMGVAGGVITIANIAAAVEQINVQGSNLILISDAGTIIVHPDSQNISRHTLISLANEVDNPELLALAKQLRKKRTAGIARLEQGILDPPSEYVAYAPIANNDWTLLSVIPEAVVLAPLQARLLRWVIYGGLSGVLLFVILYYLVTATLRKTLSNEAAATRARLFAEAKEHAQTEFLRHVCPELRASLNAIRGFANVAKYDYVTPPEVIQLLDGINTAAEGLTKIVAEMLAFAQREENDSAETESPTTDKKSDF